jgi:MYXO-CTERM domain-containing protein
MKRALLALLVLLVALAATAARKDEKPPKPEHENSGNAQPDLNHSQGNGNGHTEHGNGKGKGHDGDVLPVDPVLPVEDATSPVPEPHPAFLFLAGLGLIVSVRYVRRGRG